MRRRPTTTVLLLGLLTALLTSLVVGPVAASPPTLPSDAQPLRAGVATVDITPQLGSSTLGFVRPDIAVAGVHTRLTGRALALDDGVGQPVVLLSTDLGFPLRKADLVARVADLGYTAATIVYHGSHTHAGPQDLEDWQVDQLARAIRNAHDARVPVVAGWGVADVGSVNRNRSVEAHLANHGMDLFYGQGHAQDDPQGAAHTRSTTVRVLRIDRADGSGPLTAWTHFPVHLTTVTPGNDLWDADLAGAATWHLAERIDRRHDHHDHVHEEAGFTALYANGAQGDLMPRFDSYNPQALVDVHGRRLAQGAFEAWRAAETRLQERLEIRVEWARACYCGQEVDDAGHRVSSEPVWGLPFLGGSEDGASIFHEPLATEGRRRPAALADPVHGRKIIAAPSRPVGVHDTEPEFAAVRVGNRVMLATPGEPSVEMGRRFVAAVEPVVPRGILDVFPLGLANGYLGYLVTPEEYEQQHYEGGHTVFGRWTSQLALNELVAAASRLEAPDQPAPPTSGDGPTLSDPTLGGPEPDATLVEAPTGTVERMDVVEVAWTGAEQGTDRPVDTPFVALQRRGTGGWVTEASDLGVAVVWRQEDDLHRARIDLRRDLPLGRYRVRITGASYDLTTRSFAVAPSTGLRLRGAQVVTRADGRRWIRIVGQNPPPDPDTAVLWRPVTAVGGTVEVTKGRETRIARWDPRLRGWVLPDWQPGCGADGVACPSIGYTGVTVHTGGVRDAHGNTNADTQHLTFAEGIGPAEWPGNIGVGGGRTPGPGGEGSFPP